jgi:hypothetical protein
MRRAQSSTFSPSGVTFARQGQEKFEFVDQGVSLYQRGGWSVVSYRELIEKSDQSMAIEGLFLIDQLGFGPA